MTRPHGAQPPYVTSPTYGGVGVPTDTARTSASPVGDVRAVETPRTRSTPPGPGPRPKRRYPAPSHPAARTPRPDTRVQPSRTGADILRFVPPVSALGTAFVLQVIAVTDILGGTLADRLDTRWAYIPAMLLGLSVAACAEGGAAYLMDLYDRHLLARDSTWLLRIGMVGYVALSAAAIHWWADTRGLPTIMSWLLAGMSASALFLWSRGSRWKNREAMRAAGQIDPALPRLPISSKVLHPVRWLVTLYLISWEPAGTTAEARKRYRRWRLGEERERFERLQVQQQQFFVEAAVAARRAAVERDLTAERARVAAELHAEVSVARAEATRILSDAQAVRAVAEEHANSLRESADALYAAARLDRSVAATERADADRMLAEARTRAATADRTARGVQPRVAPVVPIAGRSRTGDEPTVAQLADTLAEHHGQVYVGSPAAMATLRQVYGSCSKERAIEAKNLHNSRREANTTRTAADGADDAEEQAS